MIREGYYDYAAFVNAGPHCSGCREIPPACICAACDDCGEFALEPNLIETPGGDMICAKCDENRAEAAWEAQQEAALSEPPMTAEEQYRAAWAQKQELTR